MPFVPHTDDDIKTMLKTIHAKTIDTLFDEIPKHLLIKSLNKDVLPPQLSEFELGRLMQTIAQKDEAGKCFIGAGAYEHYIPAAVWQITSRGEFLTAYTPYQAEASQGSLQLLYEYQTMMANLMGLDISNASLYEGASAVAEAVLMAVRINPKSQSKLILIPKNLHPHYRETIYNIVHNQNITIEEMDFDPKTGTIDTTSLKKYEDTDVTAMVINNPNFFGGIEDVDTLTDWAEQRGIITIAVVNPTAMALLNAPGHWGKHGVDITCGEGQPLGLPLASGGPYFGFMCCKKTYVRQMPGRLCARTTDLNGQEAFTLTLQAREQHIRRSKATSNICTNQGLLVVAATIYMSLMGYKGLKQVAALSHTRTKMLKEKLKLRGIHTHFETPFFHELVLNLPLPAQEICEKMAAQGIQAGFDLSNDYPELGNALLVCATETKTEQDVDEYVEKLLECLNSASAKNNTTTKTSTNLLK